MRDKLGREAEYLRLSLTDKCNLRCIYCMPEKECCFLKEEDILSDEEVIKIVQLMAKLGIKKVRLTGGEPLIRENILFLIKEINKIEGIEEIFITTNALLFNEREKEFKEAGLKGVNISLDSLNEKIYRELTRGGNILKVFNSIENLLSQNVKVKLNSVIIHGKNNNGIVDLAELTLKYKLDLRFIELMPVGCAKGLIPVSNETVKEILSQKYKFTECKDEKMQGPAKYIMLPNALGRVGFISAISDNFCSTCNRIRLTPEGFLKQCLHWNYGIDIRDYLRKGIRDEVILEIIKENIYNKPDKHSFGVITEGKDKRNMNQIGG